MEKPTLEEFLKFAAPEFTPTEWQLKYLDAVVNCEAIVVPKRAGLTTIHREWNKYIESLETKPCRKCGMPWDGKHCDHE